MSKKVKNRKFFLSSNEIFEWKTKLDRENSFIKLIFPFDLLPPQKLFFINRHVNTWTFTKYVSPFASRYQWQSWYHDSGRHNVAAAKKSTKKAVAKKAPAKKAVAKKAT
ncbi:MAG: hypothetical protein RIS75_241, partial [Actinomycetota bacterium]